MRDLEHEPTRCAFIVCRIKRSGEPYVLLVRDERWGDLTLIGGHEEPADRKDLDNTARREAMEELGAACASGCINLVPLTKEIGFGPTWSKSAAAYKKYSFKFYGMQFKEKPCLKEGRNEVGLILKLVKQKELEKELQLSNVVKLFLDVFRDRIHEIPLSWDEDWKRAELRATDPGKTAGLPQRCTV
jgi:8-oxo-dGTP pyrophosphatase MutT (NUDIX family)